MQELEKILKEIDEEKKHISLSPDYSNEYAVAQILMAEKIEKIIRKHMNDGWIPVEEEMPESLQRCLITVLIPDRKAAWSKEKTFARIVDISIYDSDEFNGWDGYRNVIAWRPLPEPYRTGGRAKG